MEVNCLLGLLKSYFLLCISQIVTWKTIRLMNKVKAKKTILYIQWCINYKWENKFLFSSVLWTSISLKSWYFLLAVTGSDRQWPTKPLPVARQGRPVVPSAHMADTSLPQDGCQNRTSSSRGSCRNSERMLWNLNWILIETKSLLEHHQQKDHLKLNSLVLVLSYLSLPNKIVLVQKRDLKIWKKKRKVEYRFPFSLYLSSNQFLLVQVPQKNVPNSHPICEKLQNINHSNF